MNDNDNKTVDLEIMPSGVVEAQERAQIDTQIATAKRYPRNVAQVKASMLAMATLDEETAAGCFYTLPTRKDGEKPIQGPSVRMAEIALSSWGNLKAASRIIGDDGKSLTAQAVVIDLEKNVSVSIEVRRRVTTRDGRRYSDDMVNTTANAACSIALRNATFRVVPGALIKPVTEAAKRVAVGNLKSITKTRSEIFDRLKKKGITEAQIFAAVGVSKMDEVDADKVADLIGIGNAIKEGTVTLEEAFPPVAPAAPKTVFRKPEPTVEATPTTEPSTPPPSVGDEAPHAAPVEAQEHRDLFSIITGAGATFDTFLAWAIADGYPGAADWTGIADVPVETAAKLVKAGKGLAAALKGGAR